MPTVILFGTYPPDVLPPWIPTIGNPSEGLESSRQAVVARTFDSTTATWDEVEFSGRAPGIRPNIVQWLGTGPSSRADLCVSTLMRPGLFCQSAGGREDWVSLGTVHIAPVGLDDARWPPMICPQSSAAVSVDEFRELIKPTDRAGLLSNTRHAVSR